MDSTEEMKNWVAALSVSEKRFIKLLGRARSGNQESQQLEYFDWLNRADVAEPLPKDAKFTTSLATVSNRLKDLILDGLRLLNKDANTDALLRTTLDEIAILQQKKLMFATGRQLKRAKKLAMERSRYGFALQCIKIEQEIAQGKSGNNAVETMEALRQEELTVLSLQSDLMELQYRHGLLQARMAEITVPRTSQAIQSLQTLASGEIVARLIQSGNYLEQALAANIQAIVFWIIGEPMKALPTYVKLLQDWNAHPEWQNDQAPLLYFICNCYQHICFYSDQSVEETQRYLGLIPNFKGLSADVARDFQRMLYHNQFAFVFNTGRLESVPPLIAEIDEWLHLNAEMILEARLLPFLHNFLVAEFILGDHAGAKRRVQRILNLPQRKVRSDIREFAQVMHAILAYESGDQGLDDYLLRAGRRYFKKYSREREFELVVYTFLEKAVQTNDGPTLERARAKLIQQLELLSQEVAGTAPLLGLFEILLWAKSAQQGQPLREVFLQAVKENLESIG